MSDKNKRALFDAVSGIDDDLIDEASITRPRTASKILWRLVAAAAALAIVLTALLWPNGEKDYVTAPGLFSIFVQATDEDGNIPVEAVPMEKGISIPYEYHYSPAVSYRRYAPFTFHLQEDQYIGMDLTMEVYANAGMFYKNLSYDPSWSIMSDAQLQLHIYHGQHFTTDIGSTLYWFPHGFDYDYWAQQLAQGIQDSELLRKPCHFESNPSYIDVIFRANDLIIGYCVIEITEVNGVTGYWAGDFSFKLIEMVSFPKVDGYWQNVKESYVLEQIQLLHDSREE